jgi:hypothetical protein
MANETERVHKAAKIERLTSKNLQPKKVGPKQDGKMTPIKEKTKAFKSKRESIS